MYPRIKSRVEVTPEVELIAISVYCHVPGKWDLQWTTSPAQRTQQPNLVKTTKDPYIFPRVPLVSWLAGHTSKYVEPLDLETASIL